MRKHLIAAFFLIAYIIILIKIMVFKDMPVIRIGQLMLNFGGTHEGSANLFPFKTIFPYLLGEKGLIIGGINLVGNIILLVPIGFLIPFVFQHITWKTSIFIAVVAGLIIEGMQVVLRVGIFDIDDVILNAFGVIMGYWAFAILTKWLNSGQYKNIITSAIAIIVVAGGALYTIYPKRPINAEKIKSDNSKVKELETTDPQGEDPCKGTGGTGQIVSIGNNTFTIKGHNGINKIIKLTNNTKITNSKGSLFQSDLKIGNRVTVVIDDSETASLVLICNQ
ncbi:VanZ family protein [Emticicia sp. SJ17W-69]|uniref:VanZ family protein n=1 Tax=Emticicia sp. SJ17W-69 TaxID=3421657 RepID=UPI003EB6F713